MLIRCALLPLLILLAALAGAPAASAQTASEPALDRNEARRLAAPTAVGTPSAAATERIIPSEASRNRLELLRQSLNPAVEGAATVNIRAFENYLDFDKDRQIFYSPGRTRVQYGQYSIEADRLIFDQRLQEVQAEGNVSLKFRDTTIRADSMRYNLREREGSAQNVNGQYGPVYFRMAQQPAGAPPQLQRVSENESIFRNTNVTTCDFKVPHYFIRGREVILYQNDRIFFRGATVYISGVPVLYLPVYTRSLIEPSPWSVQLGYGSRTGARVRLGYRYSFRTEEPSFDNPGQYETRSEGVARVYADLLSRIGYGAGLDFDYRLNDGQHRGQATLYGLSDHNRKVVGAKPDTDPTADADEDLFSENSRWRFGLINHSQLAKDLTLILNVDEYSDPDIFYDVLDFFQPSNEFERNRQVTRSARGALTYSHEVYVARIMAQVQDRIGRNRFTDFSNPRDNDRDFDLDPNRRLEDVDADGISSHRWGRVSEQLPRATFATSWLPIARRPLYYNAQIDIYRALDKGFNTVSREDDAWVGGFEFYQSLMRQWKLSDRYTLLTRAGVGVGAADRDNHDMGIEFDDTFPQTVDGLTFVDDDTFLVGKRRRSFDDINPFYAWADAEARLNARFSDAVTGWLGWRGRKTTDDFIGDWYASTGSNTFREDLYNYKIRENWVETQLNYQLAQPILNLYARGGANLVGKEDLYSQEPVAYAQTGYNWRNQLATLRSDGSVGIRRRQIFDPTDPDEYQENKLFFNWLGRYQPIHQRWWTQLEFRFEEALNPEESRDSNSHETFFSDTDPHREVRWTVNRQLGPKYSTDFMIDWDKQVGGLHELSWIIRRDLHDAVAHVEVRMDTHNRRGENDVDDRTDQRANNMDVRFGLDVKLAQKAIPIGADTGRTIAETTRAPELAY
ncbi:hypothetical protein LLG95_01870 [bacterium]|nr:hypothetical protein [bacterium]